MSQPRTKNPGYVLRANAWVVTPEEPHPFHTTCLWERYETGWGFTREDRGASSGTRHWRLPGRVTSDGGRGAMLTSDGRGSQVPMSGLTRSARTSNRPDSFRCQTPT